MRRLTYEFVKKAFEDAGCKLLASTYPGSQASMEYVCECGQKSRISWNNFRIGIRCRACAARNNTITFDQARKRFADGGCTLLATAYVDCKTKMPYICECGNRSEISLAHFTTGRRCALCGNKKKGCYHKPSLQDVRKYFESHGCVLLSDEYKNNRTKLSYICKCGEPSLMTYINFQRVHCCRKCRGL